ncbi:DEAD/DEAH box helicase [Sorangium sp. So ce216]
MATTTTHPWTPDVHLRLRSERSPIVARDHQLAAWDRLSAHFIDKKKRAGLIVVPTGGGKTILAAHWLLEHHIRHGGRVLWLAHRRSLLRQALHAFQRLGNVAFPKETLNLIALSSSDARWSNVSPEHDVVFSSMQTAVLENNRGYLDVLRETSPQGLFVAVDEAHHAPAPGYYRLLKSLKKAGCPLLGLTATPVRIDDEDQKRLGALFDDTVVYQVTRRELTQQQILAAPSFETVKTQVDLEKDFTEDDYKHLERYGELGPAVLARLAKHAGRNRLIVERYLQKKDQYGPTIVFAADTLHASTLAAEFKKKGIDADYVDYSRKDAQDIIQKYQHKKKPDVLVNVEMLTEGFDAPHTRTVFIARPTRSEGLLSQMVGRALRGKRSGGNEIAYLVTFLDTWEQFNVLDAEYVLKEGEDIDGPVTEPRSWSRIPIPLELIREAYRLLQSNVRGTLTGVYECLPHGWYTWEEMFEDDNQRRTVMVFDNQADGFGTLLAAYPSPESVPAEVSEDLARHLVRTHFADAADPLPRWADVAALLDARRKDCAIHWYTFEEKKQFDPVVIARSIVEQNLTQQQRMKGLQGIWDEKPACRQVYRDDFRAFLEDVSREETNLITPAPQPAPPDIVKIVPKGTPRAWPKGQPGYSLVAVRDAVLGVKRHFPNGAPLVADLQWTMHAHRRLWGFFRYSDKTISINCSLNSPDVPLFVIEFLMFHELLHADMPSAGHNKDFRQRERAFQPSLEAVDDATKRGVKASTAPEFWRARAEMFLDTFHRYYAKGRPGALMDL